MNAKISLKERVIFSLVLLLALTGCGFGLAMLVVTGKALWIVLGALGVGAAFVLVAAVVACAPLKALAAREEDLERLRTTDEMTGLHTRRHVIERLSVELKRSLRTGESLSCALLDIDGFREINEKLGQDGGDSVLRSIGRVIQDSCRRYDTAGRYDSEEFLIVLPGAELDNAARMADRLRRRIEATQFACHGQGFSVTVSIGVAQADIYAAETQDVLIARAVKAVERAAAEGRNRVAALATLAFVEHASTPASGLPRQADLRRDQGQAS